MKRRLLLEEFISCVKYASQFSMFMELRCVSDNADTGSGVGVGVSVGIGVTTAVGFAVGLAVGISSVASITAALTESDDELLDVDLLPHPVSIVMVRAIITSKMIDDLNAFFIRISSNSIVVAIMKSIFIVFSTIALGSCNRIMFLWIKRFTAGSLRYLPAPLTHRYSRHSSL